MKAIPLQQETNGGGRLHDGNLHHARTGSNQATTIQLYHQCINHALHKQQLQQLFTKQYSIVYIYISHILPKIHFQQNDSLTILYQTAASQQQLHQASTLQDIDAGPRFQCRLLSMYSSDGRWLDIQLVKLPINSCWKQINCLTKEIKVAAKVAKVGLPSGQV